MEKEKTLQEIDPITGAVVTGALVGAAIGSVLLAGQLIALLLQSLTYISEAKKKYDRELTAKINAMLGKTKWKVLIIKDKSPNAFVIGPRVIMITTGLKKMLTNRELVAVMLHEAWHVKSFHVYKQVFLKWPLLSVAAGAAFMALTAGASIYLAIFLFFIFKRVAEIPYDITVGRRQETKSDSYAVKMGYGKELASALRKLEKIYLKEMKGCVGVCKIVNKMSEAMDEHPPLKKRVERILKKTEMAKALASRKASQIKKIVMQGFKK